MARATRSVKLRDVAEAAGVSQGTASNVFNRPGLVREEVRERVLKTAHAMGYSGPSPVGRLLRAGKVNAIGVAAAEPLEYFFTDPWARRFLTEVAEICDARGAGLALVSMSKKQHLGWGIESAVVDGFLLRCAGRELLVEIAQRRGLPFVALSRDAAEPDVPTVDIDNLNGAFAAAQHLLDLGHRRFAVLGIGLGDDPVRVTPQRVRATRFVNVSERARGYWTALAAAGEPEEEVPVLAVRNDGANVGAALSRLLASGGPPPTALLAMSDLVALKALTWLAAQGLRVPEDVSVIGFDGIPEAACSIPPLTTVEQPYRLIAERSVAAILDGAMPEGREVLPVSLIVRASTGPAPRSPHGSDTHRQR